MSDVVFQHLGGVGLVTLNRPKALNALTHDMVLRLEEQLLAWRDDGSVRAVVIKGAGERAFCAGGDVRALWRAAADDPAGHGHRNFAFYDDEYRLNALIFAYPKPYVALMDGVVMGGGVGVSIHGSHRIAGDRTLFAMPETGIGLFPDVGATWFLSRMPDRLGVWLGLTGARLGPADCLTAGVCDAYVPSERHAALAQALCAVDLGDQPAATINATIARFRAEPSGGGLSARRSDIARLFAGGSAAGVLSDLDAAAAGDAQAWAHEQAAIIRAKSPTSTHLAFRQCVVGADLDFAACMALESRLAHFCMTRPDFYAGVNAVVIEKSGAPQWAPDTLDAVDVAQIDALFVAPPTAP